MSTRKSKQPVLVYTLPAWRHDALPGWQNLKLRALMAQFDRDAFVIGDAARAFGRVYIRTDHPVGTLGRLRLWMLELHFGAMGETRVVSIGSSAS
jgi:hypothetical protein